MIGALCIGKSMVTLELLEIGHKYQLELYMYVSVHAIFCKKKKKTIQMNHTYTFIKS